MVEANYRRPGEAHPSLSDEPRSATSDISIILVFETESVAERQRAGRLFTFGQEIVQDLARANDIARAVVYNSSRFTIFTHTCFLPCCS